MQTDIHTAARLHALKPSECNNTDCMVTVITVITAINITVSVWGQLPQAVTLVLCLHIKHNGGVTTS